MEMATGDMSGRNRGRQVGEFGMGAIPALLKRCKNNATTTLSIRTLDPWAPTGHGNNVLQ